MKNLIYQYWNGPKMEKCAEYGVECMKAYAKQIGAEYVFERDSTFFKDTTSEPVAFNSFKPVFDDNFHGYDNVLTLDTDIFPVDNITENIFEEDLGEMNICEEVHMPALKTKQNDWQHSYSEQERWSKEVEKYCNIDMPKNKDGLYKIYNGGLAIYSKEGMKRGKELLWEIEPFLKHFKSKFRNKLFWRDQAYVHAMFIASGLKSKELDVKWNTQIHWEPNTQRMSPRPVIDNRNDKTCFVHMQLTGSGSWDKQKLWEAVNLPVELWGR